MGSQFVGPAVVWCNGFQWQANGRARLSVKNPQACRPQVDNLS
ncbi:Unknown protein sequence [Pseudomonas syringae pv. syringae]|uniref:Uncharacterized protein n=1 Tax=Pseudomonas syringae pv. aceris TaxID=199198 RepID=A0A0L8IUD4_PSESX|nr:Unknown protein sequence [Pseudomonas syringae pv. aceris]KPB25167.1 Unknown protein sequence [Pseudomonas syringae pv. syringae]KPW19459.1 hypothetical protein ALO91_102488 [Pseudomonas syringae pv. aceris]